MIEHLTKVKNILMIPKAYLREKKITKVVRDIVLFLMEGGGKGGDSDGWQWQRQWWWHWQWGWQWQ